MTNTQKTSIAQRWGVGIAVLLAPAFAHAHSSELAGFVSGFKHPFFGVDHLLAMLGVGLISARIAGHFIWSIPAIFVAFMVIGGALGANGIEFPLVEWGIALSVVALGIGNLVVRKAGVTLLALIMAFVAFFGALHGHAHGAEMPRALSPVFYSLGFVVSTTSIHILGVYIGHISNKLEPLRMAPNYVGSVMVAVGMVIMFGLVQG